MKGGELRPITRRKESACLSLAIILLALMLPFSTILNTAITTAATQDFTLTVSGQQTLYLTCNPYGQYNNLMVEVYANPSWPYMVFLSTSYPSNGYAYVEQSSGIPTFWTFWHIQAPGQPGTYVYTLKASSMGVTKTVTAYVTVKQPYHDFTVSLNTYSVTVTPSTKVTITVTVSMTNTYWVNLWVSTGYVSPSTIAPSPGPAPSYTGTATWWFYAPFTPGTYTYTLKATDNYGTTKTATLTVKVNPPPIDFSIGLNPSSTKCKTSESVKVTVTVSPNPSWPYIVYLSPSSNNPSSSFVSPTFDNPPFTATWAITAPSSPGTYYYYIQGSSNGAYRSACLTLTVEPNYDFTISLGQSYIETYPNQVVSTTVTVSPNPQYPYTVALSSQTGSVSPTSGYPSFTATWSLTASSSAGTYTYTITATGGDGKTKTATLTVVVKQPPNYDFTITVSPNVIDVEVGKTATVTVTVSPGQQGYPYTVTLSPQTGTVTPSSGNPPFTATWTLTASSSAGSYTYTITATGATGKTKTATLTLIVKHYDFTISLSQSHAEVNPNDLVVVTATVSPSPEYPYTVTLSPQVGSVSPSSGTPTFTATWSITAPSTPGTYTYTITGRGGDGKTRTATLTLKVKDVYDFSISVNPSRVGVEPGKQASVTVTVSPGQQGYPYTVTLSPQVGSVSPSSGRPLFSATWTLTAPSTSGTYTYTITAAGGDGKVRTATLTLDVRPSDFAVSLSPSTITAFPNSQLTITVTVSPNPTYNYVVSLSVNTGSISPSSGNPPFTATWTLTAPSSTGSYAYTITATGDGKVRTAILTVDVVDLSITLNPSTITCKPNAGIQARVDLQGYNWPTGESVSLTVERGSIDPILVTPSPTASATWSLTAPSSIGTYYYKLTASSKFGSKDVWLTVKTEPDFSITLNPSTITVGEGQPVSATVTVTPNPQYPYAVTLSPSSGSASPTSGTPTFTATWTLTAPSTQGTYTYTITARGSDGKAKTATLTVIVKYYDFSLSISPSSITVAPSSQVSTTVTISLSPEYPYTVTLSPQVGSVSPSSGKPPFTATWTLTAPSTPGTYTYAITATSGISGDIKTHTVTITLTVKAKPYYVGTATVYDHYYAVSDAMGHFHFTSPINWELEDSNSNIKQLPKGWEALSETRLAFGDFFTMDVYVKLSEQTSTRTQTMYYYDGSWHDTPPSGSAYAYAGTKAYDGPPIHYYYTTSVSVSGSLPSAYLWTIDQSDLLNKAKYANGGSFSMSKSSLSGSYWIYMGPTGVFRVKSPKDAGVSEGQYRDASISLTITWSSGEYSGTTSKAVSVRLSWIRPEVRQEWLSPFSCKIRVYGYWCDDGSPVLYRPYLYYGLDLDSGRLYLKRGMKSDYTSYAVSDTIDPQSLRPTGYMVSSVPPIPVTPVSSDFGLMKSLANYRELAISVYQRDSVGFKLKVYEYYGPYAPVPGARVTLFIKDLSTGWVREYTKSADSQGFTSFSRSELSLPSSHEIWAYVWGPEGSSTLYARSPYGAILLERSPEF